MKMYNSAKTVCFLLSEVVISLNDLLITFTVLTFTIIFNYCCRGIGLVDLT